jgi:hypothetical protein
MFEGARSAVLPARGRQPVAPTVQGGTGSGASYAQRRPERRLPAQRKDGRPLLGGAPQAAPLRFGRPPAEVDGPPRAENRRPGRQPTSKEGHAVNEITLTGTVATKPDRRPVRVAVAFRLEGARPEADAEPLYVDIVCLPPLAGVACELEVGDHVAVFGRLDHNEWVAEDGIRRGPLAGHRPGGDRPPAQPPGSLTNDKGYTSLTRPLVASARRERCSFISGRTPYPDGVAA